MDYESGEIAVDDFTYFEKYFEAFFCRYWIEHEVMFYKNGDSPPPDVDTKFLELY